MAVTVSVDVPVLPVTPPLLSDPVFSVMSDPDVVAETAASVSCSEVKAADAPIVLVEPSVMLSVAE